MLFGKVGWFGKEGGGIRHLGVGGRELWVLLMMVLGGVR